MTTPQGMLARIAEIIESVDQRCMACDGPVTPTLKEMRQSEISEIYKLAKRGARQAAAPQGREALELADDLISELANKFYSIDPYTRAGTTEGARHDLAAIDKVKAKIRAALTPAVAGEKIEFRRQWIEQIRDQLFAMGQLPSGPLGDWAFLFREMLTDALAQEPGEDRVGPPESIQGWEVAVSADGVNILTIGHNHLAGIENIDDYAGIVGNCAQHLLAFIGEPPPQVDSGREETISEVQRLRIAMAHACDLLTERVLGSPARSAGHNARVALESALALRPERSGGRA